MPIICAGDLLRLLGRLGELDAAALAAAARVDLRLDDDRAAETPGDVARLRRRDAPPRRAARARRTARGWPWPDTRGFSQSSSAVKSVVDRGRRVCHASPPPCRRTQLAIGGRRSRLDACDRARGGTTIRRNGHTLDDSHAPRSAGGRARRRRLGAWRARPCALEFSHEAALERASRRRSAEKLLIALTGLALFLYLVVHLVGNSLLFLGPEHVQRLRARADLEPADHPGRDSAWPPSSCCTSGRRWRCGGATGGAARPATEKRWAGRTEPQVARVHHDDLHGRR